MSDEQEIHDLFERWRENLRKKDFDALIKDYASDFSCFDVMSNVEGAEAYKALWEACMPYFNEPVPEYKNYKVDICGDMALIRSLTRMTGMNVPPEMENSPMLKSWLRLTIVVQKIDGVWKVLHEHTSYPVDCENEKPAYILDN